LKCPDERRAAVVKLLERFHGHLAPNILAEERVACGAQVEESLNQFAGHALGLLDRGSHHDNLPAAEAAYLQRLEARLPAEAWKHDQFAVLWGAAHRMRDGFAKPLPDGLDISQVVCVLEEVPAPAWWQLCQRGTALHLVPKSEQAVPTGSPLAEFRLRLPQVELRWTDRDGKRQQEELRAGASIEVPLLTEPSGVAHLKVSGDLGDAEVVLAPHPPWADRFWRDGSGLWVETTVRRFEWKVEDAKPSSVRRRKPKLSIVPQDLVTRLLWPTWAKRLDKDEHGLFAEVELADKVVTRLRWIPPGRFLMGAPVAENGRDDEKGPQHWVKLSMGYWLADAPCTQAEWQAVMGTTRSHFKGAPDLPAEQVNWKDCLAFCTRLQARFPGLQARLPSEAEWEYACRAGTASAFNDGSACTEPQGKDPALAKLGYYDNNSEGKTHVVCCLAPNQWGLHDMHGNVWEWCQDGHGGWYGDHAADEQEDPVREGGHQRVIRGGSWINRAGFCRSACRSGRQPSVRIHSLGFRLASGQSGQDSKSSQERAAGKLEGRRPDATGGERAGKQKKGRK
jgi:formylglycine-generating enzyme required for sulfatase activity